MSEKILQERELHFDGITDELGYYPVTWGCGHEEIRIYNQQDKKSLAEQIINTEKGICPKCLDREFKKQNKDKNKKTECTRCRSKNVKYLEELDSRFGNMVIYFEFWCGDCQKFFSQVYTYKNGELEFLRDGE